MEIIRNNIFETNSSSTHSLTIGNPLGKRYLPYGKYLKIRWIDTDDERVLSTLTEKVSYLVSHIADWYKYNVRNYDELLEEIKNDWEFKKIETYVKNNFNKEIIFPEYNGNIEDVVEINHQLQAYNHSINEIIEEMMNRDIDYLDTYLQDGEDVEFGYD